MRNTNRRTFMMSVAAGGGALTLSALSARAAAPALTEADPQAVALGFKLDTTKVDKAKFAQHTPAQMCGGCNFFQGKAGDASAPCQLFAGKAVPAKGWCSAWAKKA